MNTDRLHKLTQQLDATIARVTTELADLEEQIAELEPRACNGTEYWRDSDSPKLYVIHSIGKACPVHGQPDPGDRVRSYIGTKPDRIEAAQEAMRNANRLEIARRRHNQLASTLRMVERDIEAFLRRLDH